MSLDLHLESEKCHTCGHQETIENFNYTYNCSEMWYDAMPEDSGNGMVYVDGMTGKESVKKLKKAIKILRADPAKYNRMNPENGWGDYIGFVKWLEEILEVAKKNPNAKWESWR